MQDQSNSVSCCCMNFEQSGICVPNLTKAVLQFLECQKILATAVKWPFFGWTLKQLTHMTLWWMLILSWVATHCNVPAKQQQICLPWSSRSSAVSNSGWHSTCMIHWLHFLLQSFCETFKFLNDMCCAFFVLNRMFFSRKKRQSSSFRTFFCSLRGLSDVLIFRWGAPVSFLPTCVQLWWFCWETDQLSPRNTMWSCAGWSWLIWFTFPFMCWRKCCRKMRWSTWWPQWTQLWWIIFASWSCWMVHQVWPKNCWRTKEQGWSGFHCFNSFRSLTVAS